MVQWLRIHASTAEGMGLIPDRGRALMQWQAAKTNKKNINVNMFIHYYGIFFPNMFLNLGEGRLLWHLFSKYVPNFGGGE